MSERAFEIFGDEGKDITQLHAWHHDDYAVAKSHILQSVGSVDGLWLTGKQILVAVYVRPIRMQGSIQIGRQKTQKADWYEGKVALILKTGPEAFQGDASYLRAMFRDSVPPKVGDWLFTNANAGIQISHCGSGAARVIFKNALGKDQDVYEWAHGWPCRIITDDSVLGLVEEPHTII